jgi:hypothetical protein
VGLSRKSNAIRAYLGSYRDGVFTIGSIPAGEFMIATKDGEVFHNLLHLEEEVSGSKRFEGFDLLLTAN